MPEHIFRKALMLLTVCTLWATAVHGGSNERSISFADAADLAVSASLDLRSEYKGLKIREKAWVLGLRSYLPRLNLSAQENDRLQ